MSHDDHSHTAAGTELPTGVEPIPASQAAPAAAPAGTPSLDIPHARTAPPATPAPAPRPSVSDDGILRPIQESDYFTLDPTAIRVISANIDEYFNQPLDMFPFWENEGKPDRFHVLFRRQIEERFPVDTDIRGRIYGYGRRVFNALRVHVLTKRLTQALSIVGFVILAILGPTLFEGWTGSQAGGLGLAALSMLIVVGLFFGLSSVLFVQYRFRLENDSYELSREVVQRTRELQNLFTNARAMSDQAETQFSHDGKGWGERALFLTRLTMWIGARMEYLEKFTQMELWRTRRERYWMGWAGGLSVSAVLVIGLLIIGFWPVPGADEVGYRVLQGFAAVLALAVSWLSFYRWQTPMAAVRDKLGVEGWVRYASLDVDNTVGDQVRRDKERLVEYRALTRGR
jgi:ABC-type multidrug transport system fused ATPase/permease subunit